ncbi:MAG: primosomal protein N' [Chlamydiales bacterium]|nr:primosomal protein N' [Chlamydiales bacterium]
MSFKLFATVLIDKNIQKPLDYGIPDHLSKQVSIGSRVLVPVRNVLKRATVLHVRKKSAIASVQPINEVLLEDNILTDDLFDLAEWMSEYYATSLQRVINTMLPSSVKKNTKEKQQLFIERAKSVEQITEICALIRRKKPAQAKVLDIILEHPKGILLTELLEKSGSSPSAVHALIQEGSLNTQLLHIDRIDLLQQEFFPTKPKILNEEQQVCLDAIVSSIKKQEFTTHLIHGVTGSGKTEVYLQAIQETIALNKDVIFLVPEIALTSQTIERLRARFQNKIAILHHRLSDGERFDSWHNMRKGNIKLVVGARSAIFSPLEHVGLIIVDEEQESSYKQSEEMPTYHARDVAIVRAKLINATVILGSATPSLESYQNAISGKYNLLKINHRAGHSNLPQVHIVNMNTEKEKKNFSMFSDMLLSKIKKRYECGEQTILFLNRRGYYSYLCCKECSEVVKCPHCDVSLTFHKGDNLLACHVCGFTLSPPPTKCKCGSKETFQFKGPGTEQVERSLKAIFPFLRLIRMDGDTTRHKGSHDELFRAFKSGKADVLIGTQMIGKGLHFPAVTLVGILQADHALHVPDFRASEHAFQLITQVAGRSGRSSLPGEVIIQTTLVEHPIITDAAQENYPHFFAEELKVRQMFDYPPFKRITKVVFSSEDEEKTRSFAKAFYDALIPKLPKNFSLTAISPCGCSKIKNKFRFQFVIKGTNQLFLSKVLSEVYLQLHNHKIKILIDIDPIVTYS